jgi:D-beta-D-heptose 7-phosphate kinase/D-beta-D-heptose 1-phosphate adenosyltransferase
MNHYIGYVLGRIIDRKDLKEIVKIWRAEEKVVVFTNGCFDILHRGHVEYLSKAKALGDILILGLNSDKSVKKLKGADRPFVTEKDRAYILSQLVPVDAVSVFEEETPLKLIKLVMPDVLVKGGDYTPDTIVGRKEVEENGGTVVAIPLVEGRSTTGLIDRIRNAAIEY